MFYKSEENFVQWTKLFGTTAINSNFANFAYNLKIHKDWNHFYLAGFSYGWHQVGVGRAGWITKFNLVNQQIVGEVSFDISLGGWGSEFVDLELNDDGTFYAVGSCDASAAGQGYLNLVVKYDQAMNVLMTR